MSMRTDWVAAKAKARRMNNNAEVKFAKDLKLGAALDKMETAEKAYLKVKGAFDANWAKATDAWVAAAAAANKLARQYLLELEDGKPLSLKVNSQARHALDTAISMHILSETVRVKAEGQRLEAKLKQHRQK